MSGTTQFEDPHTAANAAADGELHYRVEHEEVAEHAAEVASAEAPDTDARIDLTEEAAATSAWATYLEEGGDRDASEAESGDGGSIDGGVRDGNGVEETTWTTYWDQYGTPYFHDASTGATQYEDPLAAAAAAAASTTTTTDDSSAQPCASDVEQEWVAYSDEHGLSYYYNTLTGATQYDDPWQTYDHGEQTQPHGGSTEEWMEWMGAMQYEDPKCGERGSPRARQFGLASGAADHSECVSGRSHHPRDA